MCLDSDSIPFQPQILGFLSYLIYKEKTTDPILIISPNQNLKTWEKFIKLYMPNLDYIIYSTFNDSEDFISRYEFYSNRFFSIKFDLMMISYESFNNYFSYLLPVDWKTIILETDTVESHNLLKTFKNLNSPLAGGAANSFRVSVYNNTLIESLSFVELVLFYKWMYPGTANRNFAEINLFQGLTNDQLSFYTRNDNLISKFTDKFDSQVLLAGQRQLVKIFEKNSVVLKYQSVSQYPLKVDEKIVVVRFSSFQRDLLRKFIITNVERLKKIDAKVEAGTGNLLNKNLMVGLIEKLLEVSNNPWKYKTGDGLLGSDRDSGLFVLQSSPLKVTMAKNSNSGQNAAQASKNEDQTFQSHMDMCCKLKWLYKFLEVGRGPKNSTKRVVVIFNSLNTLYTAKTVLGK